MLAWFPIMPQLPPWCKLPQYQPVEVTPKVHQVPWFTSGFL